MKQKIRLKAISMLLLACLCSQAIPAQSAEIFLNYSTANRLYIDLIYQKQMAASKTRQYNLCVADRTLLEQKTELLSTKITGLQADKDIYKKESDDFRNLYVEADKKRVEAVNAAPSRLRWFLAGVIATLAAAAAGFAATR